MFRSGLRITIAGGVAAALLLVSCASLANKVPNLPAEFTQHRLTLKALTTKDYLQYGWTQKNIEFSIALPAQWTVAFSTILDARGRKVAEFSPGFVEGPLPFELLPDQGRVLSGPDSESTVLSKERLSFGSRRVVRVSESAVVHGGLDPPVRLFVDLYYVELPEYTFAMAFQFSASAKPTEEIVRSILQSVQTL